MEQRNPYAPPKAPLVHDDLQPRLPAEADTIEYGGFWRRFGAMILDGLILAPINVGVFAALAYTRNAYLYYFVPSLVVYFVYHVYLVQRFGGTPGKRIARMRITMKDGNPVTLQAALVRYLPVFVLTALASIALVVTTLEFWRCGIRIPGDDREDDHAGGARAGLERMGRWNVDALVRRGRRRAHRERAQARGARLSRGHCRDPGRLR